MNDKSSWFSKFPKDIVQCEERTGGDPKLLEKPPYLEEKAERVNYKELFGTPDTDKKGKAAASPKKGAQGTLLEARFIVRLYTLYNNNFISFQHHT